MQIIRKNLNSLQYLRVFAIFAVFFLHTQNPFAVGHFGVDIFFVISGYVMAMIAMKEVEPSHFIKDRIFRIVPLYWIATLVTFFLAFFFGHLMSTTTTNSQHLILSLLFIPFYRLENNISPVFLIGWTLMFEMMFYLSMFIGLLARKYINKSLNAVVFCFFFVLLLTFILSIFRDNSAITQFLGSQNSYIFLFGIIAYWINNSNFLKIPTLPSWLLFLLIGIAVVICGFAEVYLLKYRALSIGIPSFIIVLLATRIEYNSSFKLPKKLQNTLLVLADISFAFYIVHIFVLLGLERVGAKVFPFLTPSIFSGFIIALVLSLITAFITHFWLDKPLNGWLRARFNAKKT